MGDTQVVLGALLDGLSPDLAAIPLAGLSLDSRRLRPGDVFLAVPGHSTDGRAHIDEAVTRGASVVLAQAPCDTARWPLPVVEVENLAGRVSDIAGRFYGHPSAQMKLIGVTGTNGKSSVTLFIAQMLEAMGHPCGVIGTLGSGRPDRLDAGVNTTPDALALQATLAQWRDGGARWAAMEVSSHGLVQHRVAALTFSTAVFTNLSQDHLDYHGDMEAYGQAKARLFSMPGLRCAVLNGDDPYSRRLRSVLASSTKVVSFALASGADITASDIVYSADGIAARLVTPWGELALDVPLIGTVNLKNVMAAVAVLGAEGFDLDAIRQGLAGLRSVPGRLERLHAPDGLQVVIDYAHTPDALEQVLKSLRPHCAGKLWCVFGCGGDRDRGKRALMAAVAEAQADEVVITNDNPRSEDPQAIVDDILTGMNHQPRRVELDRRCAIEGVVAEAGARDLVLIAGKGHEDYQETAGRRLPFSDVRCARLALAGRESP